MFQRFFGLVLPNILPEIPETGLDGIKSAAMEPQPCKLLEQIRDAVCVKPYSYLIAEDA